MNAKKGAKNHPALRWAKFSAEHFSRITDVELAALKIHVVIEEILRCLLAARLKVSEDSLVKLHLTFDMTSKLALMGIGDAHLIRGIKALNKARNALSHSVESGDVQEQLTVFVREIGCMKKRKFDLPTSSSEQLDALHDAFNGAANAILDLIDAAEQK